MKFLPSLLQETVASFFPVFYDLFLALVITAHDSSVGDHRSIAKYLQRATLIEKNAVELCDADFFDFSLIVTDFSEDIAFLDHVADFFEWIPETAFLCILIADICHIQRIVCPEILDSLIDSHMAQDIADISSGGADFFVIPVAHSATFDQNTRDSLRSRIVVGTAGRHVGFYHVWNIDLFCHFTGFSDNFFCCPSCIIDIRC